MNHHYSDIRSRISEEPKWWDENAVPRYCDFSPNVTANIYAREVALCDIACQGCGARFKVAFSWSSVDYLNGKPVNHQPLTPDDAAALHYGDPPNAGCCASGPTMNCMDFRVLEFWRKDTNHWDWVRVPDNEVLMQDHPDYKA